MARHSGDSSLSPHEPSSSLTCSTAFIRLHRCTGACCETAHQTAVDQCCTLWPQCAHIRHETRMLRTRMSALCGGDHVRMSHAATSTRRRQPSSGERQRCRKCATAAGFFSTAVTCTRANMENRIPHASSRLSPTPDTTACRACRWSTTVTQCTDAKLQTACPQERQKGDLAPALVCPASRQRAALLPPAAPCPRPAP